MERTDGIQEKEIQIQITDYETLIKNHAYVALTKIKKPTIYTVEDLCQEGAFIFLWARRYYDKDKSKATFRTYLITSLRRHFFTLVSKSYDSIDRKTNFELSFFTNTSNNNDTGSIAAVVLHYREAFNSEETKYVTFLLNMPKKIQEEIKDHIGKRRIVIRRELNLSPYKEAEIRKSIKTKLETVTV